MMRLAIFTRGDLYKRRLRKSGFANPVAMAGQLAALRTQFALYVPKNHLPTSSCLSLSKKIDARANNT